MLKSRLILLILGVGTSILRAAPATQITERWEALANGEVRYTVPDWWERKSKADNDLSAFYQTGDEAGSMTIGMSEQRVPIADLSGNRMRLGKAILASIRADLEKKNAEFIQEPKLVDDPRFLVSIREEVKFGDHVMTQRHMYKMVGYFLVFVTVGGPSNDTKLDEILLAGEEMLVGTISGKKGGKLPEGPVTRPARKKEMPAGALRKRELPPSRDDDESKPSAKPAAQPQRTDFRKAAISLMPPTGWKEIAADTDEGLLATYRDSVEASSRITIRVRKLTDPAARDRIVSELATEETRLGKASPLEDKRFLKKASLDYEKDGLKLRMVSRQLAAGKVVISVTSSSAPDKSDAATNAGDELAASIAALP